MIYPTPYPVPTTHKIRICALIGPEDHELLFCNTFPHRGAANFAVSRFIQKLADEVRKQEIELSIGNEQKLIKLVDSVEFKQV